MWNLHLDLEYTSVKGYTVIKNLNIQVIGKISQNLRTMFYRTIVLRFLVIRDRKCRKHLKSAKM